MLFTRKAFKINFTTFESTHFNENLIEIIILNLATHEFLLIHFNIFFISFTGIRTQARDII